MISVASKTSTQCRALFVAAACSLVAANAHAAGAVSIQDWDGGSATLAPGSSLHVLGASGNNSSYTDNPRLNYSSWAHTGAWWNFQLSSSATTTVSVTAQAGADFLPGVTIWTSGSDVFDGGTTGFGGETSTSGFGTPHSLNSTGVLGSAGTLWMQNGEGGNMLETLAYGVGNSAIDYGSDETGWGESISYGIHDVSVSDAFESGISGSASDRSIDIILTDLAAGWYTIYIGGTDHSSTGGLYDVEVSAVPIPAAGLLFVSAAMGLLGISRRRDANAAGA